VLRGPGFTLMVFGEATGYDIRQGDFVLVRYDGYIGAITASLATIHRELSNFLGVPSLPRKLPDRRTVLQSPSGRRLQTYRSRSR
jgi:hypothetical protein